MYPLLLLHLRLPAAAGPEPYATAIRLCCYGFAVTGIIATLRIAFGDE